MVDPGTLLRSQLDCKARESYDVLISYACKPQRIFNRADASRRIKYVALSHGILFAYPRSVELTLADYGWASRQPYNLQPSVAVTGQSLPHPQPVPSPSFPSRYDNNAFQSSHLQGYYPQTGFSQHYPSSQSPGRVYQPRRYASFSRIYVTTGTGINKLTCVFDKGASNTVCSQQYSPK